LALGPKNVNFPPHPKDNTQWLILKAQELWPQHQQQVGNVELSPTGKGEGRVGHFKTTEARQPSAISDLETPMRKLPGSV